MRPRSKPRLPLTGHSPWPAKISPPRLSAALERPRLFKLLDQASRRPVIWVEGPAGSGKTTLAATWLARRGRKSLWYQIDARDRDPATFFSFLREAARRLAPRREALPFLTPEYLPGVEAYARNFFDGVFERLGAPSFLVLDDFQELPEGAVLQGILAGVLAGIPAGVHVLVLSRTAPPAELARLRANSLVASVGWDALRFTSREVARLLAEHRLPRPGAGEPDLYEEADGWAAGLVLLGESVRRGERREAGTRPRRQTELFDYFASQLFDGAEPVVQRVLLATAPLATVSAAVAERLAGEGAGAVLERLARDNIFTTRRAGGEPVFQYHPLFRAFLCARLESALAVEERIALRRRAAMLLDEAGQPEEALALLQSVGDGDGAGALVVRLAPGLVAQGRLDTLETWILGLPEAIREADPWLLHWLGVSRTYADPRESLALSRRAFAAFEALGDDAACLAAWIPAVRAVMFAGWDGSAAAPWLRWLEARMRRTPEFPSPAMAADVAGVLVSALLMSDPSHSDLPTWVARLAATIESLDDPDARARALHPLVWYRAWTGDLAAVASDADALERACRARGVTTETRISGLGVVAIAASYATCDRERTLACATEALRLGVAEGLHAHDIWLHGVAAHAHQGRGDPVEAGPHLDAIRRALGAGAETDSRYLHPAAGQALLLGDLDGALAATAKAARAEKATGRALVRLPIELDLAQIHRVRGERAAAERHLAVVEQAALAGGAAPFVWACRLMRAQLALEVGERDAGRTLLAEALAEGRRRGFTNVPFASTAHALAGLCEEALEAGLEVEYVRRLIQLHDLTPDPSRAGVEWPFALHVSALGRFALHRDGRAVARAAGRSKPLDLLKALVAAGGREVPDGHIVALLWPGADRERGRHRLKFTLHGLRRLLARVDVLILRNGLLSLDGRRVWVDAWELERQLSKLAAAVEHHREDEAHQAIERALEVYRGPLLEGEQAPWAIAARDRLEVRLRRLVVRGFELEGVGSLTPVATVELACELFPGETVLQRARALGRARAAAVPR